MEKNIAKGYYFPVDNLTNDSMYGSPTYSRT